MSRKPWRDLQFIKQIVIKPEDPKNPMCVTFKEDTDYDTDWVVDGSCVPRLVARDRGIQLGANAMYTVELDYPEDFKKLVAVTGDCAESYRIYQALQKKVPDNWADYDEGNVW